MRNQEGQEIFFRPATRLPFALESGRPGGVRHFQGDRDPETSWTYEAGTRTNHDVDLGPLTSVQARVSYYHVDFSNRLLNVAAFNFINPNPAVLVNVGGVTTNDVDLAGTLNFGERSFRYFKWLSGQWDSVPGHHLAKMQRNQIFSKEPRIEAKDQKPLLKTAQSRSEMFANRDSNRGQP